MAWGWGRIFQVLMSLHFQGKCEMSVGSRYSAVMDKFRYRPISFHTIIQNSRGRWCHFWLLDIVLHLRLTLSLLQWKGVLIETVSFYYFFFVSVCGHHSIVILWMLVSCFQQETSHHSTVPSPILPFLWHCFNPMLPHLTSLNVLSTCASITKTSHEPKLN